MRIRHVLVVIAFVAACSGGNRPTAARTPSASAAPAADAAHAELTMICDEAKAAQSSRSSGDLRTVFASKVNANLKTEQGKNIFKSAGAVNDAEKHAAIKRGAAEVGIPDWDCKAAFDTIYGPQVDSLSSP